MSVTVTSTLSNRAGRGGNVTVSSAVSLSPFRVRRKVSAAKGLRPTAMATSPSTKASRVSGTKTLSRDTRRSFLLSAANTLTVTSLTSTILTIAMVRIVDVNDVTVKVFAAESKNDLLVSLDKVFVPETREAFVEGLVAIAVGRRPFAAETFLRTLKGERLTALLTVTFPPLPARFDSVLVTVTDITERKRTEESLRQAQAELAHVTRVTTLGELTASIAHEVNQPLAAIVADANASLNWLTAAHPDLDVVRDALAAIVREGHRAADVIQHIRQLASKTEPHKARLDVNHVICEVVPLVRTAVLSHRVSLRVDLASALGPVLGDRVQLQQVLINLVMNGIEAMASVGDRPPELVIRSRPHGGDQVLAAVQDAGVGIDRNTVDRRFSAFFTPKPGGLGMGLSISRSIIDPHGGRPWATPNPTHGATFHFALPVIR